MKVCTKCGVEKDEGEYYMRDKNTLVLINECKTCKKKRNAEWQKNNREKRQIIWKRNYQNKKGTIKSSNSRWRNENAGKMREIRNKWKDSNKEQSRKVTNKLNKKKAKELHPTYLKKRAFSQGFKKDQIEKHPELLNIIKELLKAKRLCKQNTKRSLLRI